jgi:iron complex outermembrane receptor protein
VLDEIVVTARQREETLQETPLSITAFSSIEIERGALKSLEDVSLRTPGMQFNNDLAGIRPGRLFTNIRFRGIEGGEFGTLSTGSLFVDGVYALHGAQSMALLDLERVEVIKGPQSALFGRNSFAGAVNYVTTTPSLEEFSGRMLMDAGQFEQYEVAASVEGPLIRDRLSMRLGGRFYNRGGMWTATDGGKMGEQSSESVFATLLAAPTDNLQIRLRGYFQRDDDGPAAVAFFQARNENTCLGTQRSAFDAAGNRITVFPGSRPADAAGSYGFFCGTLPGANDSRMPRVDANTSLLPQHPNFTGGKPGADTILIDTLVANPAVLPNGALNFNAIPGVPDLDRVGLKRELTRLSLHADYVFANEYVLEGTLAFNSNAARDIRDWDMTPVEAWWVTNPQKGYDRSADLRLTAAPGERVSWMVGMNYYTQEFQTSSNSGTLVYRCGFTSCNGTDGPGFGFFDGGPLVATLPLDGGDNVDVWSVYGYVSYELASQWTLDLEARYQSDKRTDGLTGFSETFKDIIPRVTLSYRPVDDVTIYGLYSIGVLPGVVNSNFLNCSDVNFSVPFVNPLTGELDTSSACQQYVNQFEGSVQGVTSAQTLDAFEIGVKSQWFEGRLLTNVAAYWQEWSDQPYTFGAQIVKPLPGTALPSPQVVFEQVSLPGSSRYWGVEVESAFRASDNWLLNLSLSFNENEFTDFLLGQSSPAQAALGLTQNDSINVKGNRAGRFPKWQGSFSATYFRPVNAEWELYATGDVFYNGRAPTGLTNLAYVDDYFILNSRIGIERDNLRLEGYVTNLLNEDKWRGGQEQTDFTVGLDQFGFQFNRLGVIMLPQNKRTVGLRASMSF